jgi:hypothetical protein
MSWAKANFMCWDYTRTLSEPPRQGTPGVLLLRFAGSIPPEDLREMANAIEEGCEQVNSDGW